MSLTKKIQEIKSRRFHATVVLALSSVYSTKACTDILHLIAAYAMDYVPSSFQENCIYVQFSDMMPYDKGSLTSDYIYNFPLTSCKLVVDELLELKNYDVQVTVNFPCCAAAQKLEDMQYFYKMVATLPTKTIILADFSLHKLPSELQYLISPNMENGDIDVTIELVDPLFEPLGPVKLLLSGNEKIKVRIDRMANTRTFVDIKNSENMRVLMRDSQGRPFYVQIMWNNIMFHLLAGHFCELLSVDVDADTAKKILCSAGILDDISIDDYPKMLSRALTRQPSCGALSPPELIHNFTVDDDYNNGKLLSPPYNLCDNF